MLPKEYPNRQLVYYCSRKWTGSGLIEEIHELLRSICRKQSGREPSQSYSQSVKTSSMSLKKGYDGGKKIQGRKRHIVTDTPDLLMATVIHSADIQDGEGAKLVMEQLRYQFPRLKKILAAGGYTRELIEWVIEGLRMEIGNHAQGYRNQRIQCSAKTMGSGKNIRMAQL